MSAAGVSLVKAETVEVGDLVWFLGKAHRITAIEPIPALFGTGAWRSAIEEADSWSISLIPGQDLEVLR